MIQKYYRRVSSTIRIHGPRWRGKNIRASLEVHARVCDLNYTSPCAEMASTTRPRHYIQLIARFLFWTTQDTSIVSMETDNTKEVPIEITRTWETVMSRLECHLRCPLMTAFYHANTELLQINRQLDAVVPKSNVPWACSWWCLLHYTQPRTSRMACSVDSKQ